MTSAAAATKPVSKVTKQQVSVETFEDILYEIIATGLEPSEAELTTQQIEAFLHEHARKAKPREEFIKFFKEHKLSTDPGVHLRPSGLGRLPSKIAMPTKDVSESSLASGLEPRKPTAVEKPIDETLSPIPVIEVEPTEESSEIRIRPAQTQHSDNSLMGWLAILLIAALLGLTIGLGYLLFDELRQQIDQTKALQAENMRLIQVLQKQVTELEKTTAIDRETLQNLDAKSDLLIETLVPVESEPEK
jgi:hypothetical protein